MKTESTARRDFLRCSAAAAGGMILAQTRGASKAQGTNRPPNVVMIISDDQGWGDYGFMGHPHIQTPHLDRLASESVTFTRGYVAAPLCCPSLASMVTGLHPHQHKITSNDPPFKGDPKNRWKGGWTDERWKLREELMGHIKEVPTLPRMLRKRGYLSLQTGKWWYGHHRDGGFTHGMTHGERARGGRHGDEGLKIGRQGMQPIVDFLDEAGDKPFFLWYAPFLPHTPHNPPDRLFAKYKDKTDSSHIARYWAMCEWFDETCGQLLDILDKRGMTDDTMVLYVCDNGWIQQPDSGRFAPRSKRSPYEGGTRTPIMVRWPGHAKPRRDDETLVSSVDLVPTALAACDLPPSADMQGVNLLDVEALAKREALCGAAYTHDAVDVNDPAQNLETRWVIQGWWKLLVHVAEGKQPELYDLKSDPHEEKDLAAEQPERVKALRAVLDDWYSPA